MAQLRLIAAALLLIAMSFGAQAERRLAFVVGNDSYQNVVQLKKARNDATAVSRTLQTLGFTVSLHTDLQRNRFSQVLNAFEQSIRSGDEVFFFFSGHGFEIRGVNYLLPVDVPSAGPGQETVVKDAAFDADEVIERLRARGARVTIAVIDACRDNPFASEQGRSVGGTRGLAQMSPAEGVFILMSAGAKQMALDRLSNEDKDPNSVFTRFFIKELTKPGQTLVQTAKRTQVAVRELARTVGFEQTPAYYDQVIGDVVLVHDHPAPEINAPALASNGFSKTNPTTTLKTQTQFGPSVTMGEGVTLGQGVIVDGKQAELLIAEQQKKQGALADPSMGLAPGDAPEQVALLSPNPDVPQALLDPKPAAQPPIASFLRSNQGWSGTISLAEPATAILYRIGSDGDFIDLGQLDILDQRTGQRMPNMNFTMAGNQRAAVIEVKYQRADGSEAGPFPIRFDPETALFDMQKKTLDQLWPSWIAFREFQRPQHLFHDTDQLSLRDCRSALWP